MNLPITLAFLLGYLTHYLVHKLLDRYYESKKEVIELENDEVMKK